MERRHISASQIAQWTRCRHLWATERSAPRGADSDGSGDTWAQRIGHFVHAVEEEFKRLAPEERSEGKWLSIPTYIAEEWLENGYDPDLMAETRRRSKKILNQLWDNFGTDETHAPDLLESMHVVPLTEDCDLWVVFDDVTFLPDNKLIIGEYKTSQREIDAEERTMMQVQPYVYQWAAKQIWPDFEPIGVQYTMAWPNGTTREFRDLWPEDVAEWGEILPRLANEMRDGVVYRALSFKACPGCPLWYGDCSKKIKRGTGPVPTGGYIGADDGATTD